MRYPNLELIEYQMWTYAKEHYPERTRALVFSDFEVYVFPQTWGSTALGFGGCGGQAITTAYTTVVIMDNGEMGGVFFGNGLAYVIPIPNREFFEDMMNHNMAEVAKKGKYYKDDVH